MSQETDLIKERLDLAEIIGEYVQLKRAGNHFKGLCPFHHEKTPSFIVSPDKGIWHCFGCQANGDAFSFIQQIEAIDFPAALKMLADRAGVVVSAGPPARHDPRARQFELHGLAARFYHELLMNQPVGAKAKQYLAERGLREETMAAFSVGYAPQQWDGVQQFLQKKGFTDRELIDSGLVGKSERGTLYDRFRGRIMFPIHDIQGRVVAFGGRITPWHATGEEGKYINSPETAIYSKRRVVYNLHRAKRSLHQQPCLVVEGYLDVLLLVQAGITNVVASSGTAFGAEHIAALRRYTNTLHFAFDGDAAGIKAAEAATREAAGAGLRVATILFPAGLDPADMAKDRPEELSALLAAPISLVAVLLQHLQDTAAGADREAILARIVPLVRQTTNMVQQGELVQEIAATLHVSEAAVLERVAQSPPATIAAPPMAQESGEAPTPLLPEQLLVGLLILDQSARQAVAPQVSPDLFATAEAAALWQALTAQAGFATAAPDALLDALPENLIAPAEATRRVAEEHAARLSAPPAAEAAALLGLLRRQRANQKLRRLQERLAEASGAERAAALQEFQTALKELSGAAL